MLACALPIVSALIDTTQIWKAKTTAGLALSMFEIELLKYSILYLYHWKGGYPFHTYGENLLIMIQCRKLF